MTSPSTPEPIRGATAMIEQTSNAAEVGHCATCGQELIRTASDCWHPHSVATACPPEVKLDEMSVVEWGDGFGRPGRDQWREGAPPPREPSPEEDAEADARWALLSAPLFTVAQLAAAGEVPKILDATLEVRMSDGSVSRIRYIPPEQETLTVDLSLGDVPEQEVSAQVLHRLASRSDRSPEHRITISGVLVAEHEHLVRAVYARP